MEIEKRLEEKGYKLPDPPKPAGAYVPAVKSGNLIFTAGILPLEEGKLKIKGKIGFEELPSEQGYKAAQVAALNALSIIKDLTGDLDRIKRVVKLTGFIHSADGFTDQAKVLNGASDLLKEIFGDKGEHARVAVGVSELPLNSPVELEMVVEVA